MQQRPARDRIIRPSEQDRVNMGQDRINMGQDRRPPVQSIQDEYNETNQEELSQEDLLEWLTQKAINLENRIYKLEISKGIKTVAPMPPSASQQKPKPKQPYEEVYTQEAPEGKPKKKKQSIGRLIALFAAIILVAILIINIIGVVFLGYSLPF
jgi:hypothetical protein